VLFLLWITGCARELDLWPATREVCGLERGETLDWELLRPAEDGGLNGLVLPPDCAEALVFDLGGDPDELVAFSDQPDLASLLEADRLQEIAPTGLAEIVRGMYWLLGSDLGPLDQLEAGPYVSQRWVSEYRDLADKLDLPEHTPLSRVLYDHVTSRYSHLELLSEDAPEIAIAGTAWWSRSLFVSGEIAADSWSYDRHHPIAAMGVLVHEVAHTDFGGQSHKVECEVGGIVGRFCDADLDGAFGAEFAALWAQAAAATSERGCLDESAASEAASFAERLVLVDKGQHVLMARPEQQLLPCE
jgi:hypothetical protein